MTIWLGALVSHKGEGEQWKLRKKKATLVKVTGSVVAKHTGFLEAIWLETGFSGFVNIEETNQVAAGGSRAAPAKVSARRALTPRGF